MTKPASGGSTGGCGQLGSMSSGKVSDERVPRVGSISLESMSPPAGSLTPWHGISGESARNAPNYMSPIHGGAAPDPRHRQREGGPHRYHRNRHRLNLIHANTTTIASPRRQRRHHAQHDPAHHTERGRSHAPIVVNLDDAIIVTCGDAQQPPCSHHCAIVGFVYRGRSCAPQCVFGAECREPMNGGKLLRSVTATTRRPPRGPQCPRICHRLRSDRTRTNFSPRSFGRS
jgi:hypothetical protein